MEKAREVSKNFSRNRAPTLLAFLVLALCLFFGGAQALPTPADPSTLAANTSPADGGIQRALSPSGYETPIAVFDADQLNPVVHGTRIAWEDWRNDEWNEGKIGYQDSDGDIYSYDLFNYLEHPEGATTSDYGKNTPDDYSPAITDAGIFWILSGRSDADTHNRVQGPWTKARRGGEGIEFAVNNLTLFLLKTNLKTATFSLIEQNCITWIGTRFNLSRQIACSRAGC